MSVSTPNPSPSEAEVSDQESGLQLKLVRSKDVIIDIPLKAIIPSSKFSASELLNTGKTFNIITIEEGHSTKVVIKKNTGLPIYNPRRLDEIGLRRSKRL